MKGESVDLDEENSLDQQVYATDPGNDHLLTHIQRECGEPLADDGFDSRIGSEAGKARNCAGALRLTREGIPNAIHCDESRCHGRVQGSARSFDVSAADGVAKALGKRDPP